jgi:hypothetical protein
MSTYRIHTIESAPEKSKPALQDLEKTFGFIPNVAGAMAESPVLIGAFVPLFHAVHSGSFSEAEIQVVLLTNAVTNSATWPVALHSKLVPGALMKPQDFRGAVTPHDAHQKPSVLVRERRQCAVTETRNDRPLPLARVQSPSPLDEINIDS